MKGRLAPLSRTAIKPEQPLMYPVFNKQGTLLAEKGVCLTGEQVQKLMGLDKIFTHELALLTALVDKKTTDESNALFKLAPPFERLASLEIMLQEVYTNPKDKLNQSKLLTTVTRLQTICEKSPDAALAKIITDDNVNYAIKHAIHTAILCELSGQHLKWSRELRRNIAGAALTMNLSLGFLQNELVDQADPLSIEQRKIIHAHPTESAVLLKKMGVSNATWLELVEKHHENPEGSGYPFGLSLKEIPLEASLISLSDVYCAKVTGRNYREPIFADIAVRDIYLGNDQNAQGTLIEVFVKLLGIYPPGCIVKLKSGETGIVTKRGNTVSTPKVLLLNSAKSGSLMHKVLRNTGEKNYVIQSIVHSKNDYRYVDYNEVWPH